MSENKFYICKTEDAADLPLPSYMTEGSAGMDLYANVHNDVCIIPGEIIAVPTGIKISLPVDFEAQIRPRSGLAFKHGISMINSIGTIDADFRGEVKVLLINHGKQPFTVSRGDRIAQMIINRIERIKWDIVQQLDETKRGEGGFGHTGV